VNVLFYEWFIKTNSFRNFQIKQFLILRKKQILVLLAVIVLPILISLYRYSTYLPEGKYGEVCLVQPNYEPHYEKFVVPEMDQITRLGRLAELVINKETKFIVFPETSFGDTGDGPLNKDRIGDDNRIILFYDFIETHMNIPIVMGVTTVHILKDSSKHTPFTRINPRTNSAYEIANSAIILKNRTEQIPVYNKSRLVPGAEIFPYRKILPFLKPIVDMLGGSIQGLATQEERSVFESNGYIIAPVICYESIYGNYLRGYIKNGAQAIFVMTNDGWWDDTPGYKQHMAYSKLSAIEFRRPVLRSANTGITCFINSKGDVGKSINYGVHSAINQGITFSTEMTFYSLFGDLIAYAAFITAFILLILFFLVKQKKHN
ncbi:MAG: apolipoprotein N-acyltransferase, partial [Saprospiraceae bacterium]